ncbi:hypothetical protein DCC39_11915 [Pueribacillus theae]|uniref:Uncharacterized protein n=1 Tax=Pueribacillus theae TaxID=2171751 RepID=A0A2U1JY68_9BACI|nr:hypothetical protein [Pueribacillus theae]PWA10092.1 hypothetical protein DCC39_11915 [Pueribacillus theae]
MNQQNPGDRHQFIPLVRKTKPSKWMLIAAPLSLAAFFRLERKCTTFQKGFNCCRWDKILFLDKGKLTGVWYT